MSPCTVCQTAKIADHDGVVGACAPCVGVMIEEGEAWLEFMRKRFGPHRPLEGEMFEVEITIEQCDNGRWFACRSIGSNLIKSRISLAAKHDSELEAREFLGLT